MRLLATLALAALLSGCNLVHRIDIQQGNAVDPESFLKIRTGMTRPEVRQIVGTPLLTDVFHANRWDYYFRNERGGKFVEQNRFSVYFENDKVARIEGSPTASAIRGPVVGMPGRSPAPAPAPASGTAPAAEPAQAPAPAPGSAPAPPPK
jgi:outer membrane protein assembly factor BamE